jgi:polysaccharide biosynthesis protein PslJ
VETVSREPVRGPIAAVVLVTGSASLLAVAVLGGTASPALAAIVLAVTALALSRPGFVDWPRLLAVLVLIILFIPIRRYALPGNLPFELEPYRIFIALLVVGWFASLLVDDRTRLRRTGFEGPLALIVGAALLSIVANPTRIAENSIVVNKSLTFFLSFVVLLYVLTSVLRSQESVDTLVRTLVVGGTVVAGFAIVEARTGFNVFNQLDRVMPMLRPIAPTDGEGFLRVGSAKLRVFGSAEHPIALSAALVMLVPLALYLRHRDGRRLWIFCAVTLAVACSAAVSRTGIVMFAVIGLAFLCLRPRETRRMWPLLIPALIVVKLLLPGTLGAIKQSFLPPGGLIAEQQASAEGSGSGRLADLGPGLTAWKRHPLAGQGFGTAPIVRPNATLRTNILDNQWLTTLLTTGAIGFFGWLWFLVRAVRRFGAEAKKDDSDRAWLFAAITAGIAAYGVGMLTYDAFAFPQVTFLLFILAGIGAATLSERSVSLTVVSRRQADARTVPLLTSGPG